MKGEERGLGVGRERGAGKGVPSRDTEARRGGAGSWRVCCGYKWVSKEEWGELRPGRTLCCANGFKLKNLEMKAG